ncbi:MAG: Ig-like domain-containing protein [Deltaproteobacteria bacterium]|nr:Ig-like domain-containing protein [Deltaproteobacteria bacterium]
MKSFFVLFVLLSLAACEDMVTLGSTDSISPTSSSFAFSPSSGATSVALNASITVTASEELKSSSVTTSSFIVIPTSSTNGTTTVCTSVSYADKVLTCTHSNLAPGVAYTITLTTAVQDSSGNALGSNATSAFTSISTAGSNTPTATIVLPSFDSTAASSVNIAFSKAMDSSSLSATSVKVTTSSDTSTNLCSSYSYSSSNNQLTCTGSFNKCNGTLTKYLVTVTGDAKASTGDATTPFSGFFSNIDDGFNNSATISGEVCWSTITSVDDGAVVADTDVVNANITTAGKLTIQGDSDQDLTGANDIEPGVNKALSSVAMAMTVKVDTITNLEVTSDINGESLNFTFQDNFGGAPSHLYYAAANNDGFRAVGQQTPTFNRGTIVNCSTCFTTAPTYFCLTKTAAGALTASYDTGGTGTFTSLNTTSLGSTITSSVNTVLSLRHNTTGASSMTVDWVRYNIGSTTCPPVGDVQ